MSDHARQVKRADLIHALSFKWFRLNALYKIKDKNGRVRRFRPKLTQRERFINANRHEDSPINWSERVAGGSKAH